MNLVTGDGCGYGGLRLTSFVDSVEACVVCLRGNVCRVAVDFERDVIGSGAVIGSRCLVSSVTF